MIKVYKNNSAFLEEHLAFLEMDEIKNNLIIGIAKKATDPDAYFVSSTIRDDLLLGVILGRKMIISANTLNEKVYTELVHHMEKIQYPGIIGEKKECLTYQRVFERETSQKMTVEMDQKIYKCDTVKTNRVSTNTVRLAHVGDTEILIKWYTDFIISIEGPTPDENIKKALNLAIENRNLYVIENDHQIVSMTARHRETKNSQTVAMVYTPSEFRGKGFATKLVSEVTKIVLKNKKYATLYTDASNPTSNSIYMKIGYELYCESIVLNIEQQTT